MLKTCLGIAGLLVAPLMVWLLAPALICFAALCVLSLPFALLFIMTRQPEVPAGTPGQRGITVHAGKSAFRAERLA